MSAHNASRICTEEAAQRLGLSRDTLDRMIAEAPADLPGGPVDVGALTSKKHRWMWDPARLNEWFEAYGRWRAMRRASAAVLRPSSRSPRINHARPSSPDAPTGKLTLAELKRLSGGR